MAISAQEFAAKIKLKYPQYKNVEDTALTQSIIKKYPEYSSQVDFNLAPSAPANPAGSILKGVTDVMNPANLPGNIAKASQFVGEDLQRIGSEADKRTPRTDLAQAPKNPEQVKVEAQQKSQEQNSSDLDTIGQYINAYFTGRPSELPIVKNIADKAAGGITDVGWGAWDLIEGNVKAAGNALDVYDATEEDSRQAVKGLTKITTGLGKVVGSPIAGAIESLPETFGAKEGVKKVAGLPNDALKGLFKLLRPDLDDNFIQETLVNPVWGAVSTASLAKAAGVFDKTTDPVQSITQSKKPTETSASSTRALESLSKKELAKVKSEQQLYDLLEKKTKSNQTQSDAMLDSKSLTKLKEFKVKVGEGKNTVSVNYVQEAINKLKKEYENAKEPAALVKIRNLEDLAKTKGLSEQQLNGLAKEFGTTFGEKAFSKTGEPLKGVSAQAVENIRQGMKGYIKKPEFHASDKLTSDLIKTKDLIKKNVDAVKVLEGKLAGRSWGEAAGANIASIVNGLSGGIIRGVLSRLQTPSNVGLKTMNSLAIQDALQSNLKAFSGIANSPSPEIFLQNVHQALPVLLIPDEDKEKIKEEIEKTPGLSLGDLIPKANAASNYDPKKPSTWSKAQKEGYKKALDNLSEDSPAMIFPAPNPPYYTSGGVSDKGVTYKEVDGIPLVDLRSEKEVETAKKFYKAGEVVNKTKRRAVDSVKKFINPKK